MRGSAGLWMIGSGLITNNRRIGINEIFNAPLTGTNTILKFIAFRWNIVVYLTMKNEPCVIRWSNISRNRAITEGKLEDEYPKSIIPESEGSAENKILEAWIQAAWCAD
jgi:hypothetical protein